MVINKAKKVVKTKRRKETKHKTSVTAGKEQQGDSEGDGPTREDVNKAYLRRMAQIWLDAGSDNLFRLKELGEKYNDNMLQAPWFLHVFILKRC